MKRALFSMMFVTLLVFGAGISLPARAQGSGGRVMVTTTVKNGVVTNWNCGCPQNGTTNAFAVSMMKMMEKFSERDMAEFNQLLNEFERVNGTRVQSKTQVRNAQTVSDEIKSTSTGPMSGPGQALCDFLKRFL